MIVLLGCVAALLITGSICGYTMYQTLHWQNRYQLRQQREQLAVERARILRSFGRIKADYYLELSGTGAEWVGCALGRIETSIKGPLDVD